MNAIDRMRILSAVFINLSIVRATCDGVLFSTAETHSHSNQNGNESELVDDDTHPYQLERVCM